MQPKHPPLNEQHSIESTANEPQIPWHSAGRTHVGRVRHINEDAFLESSDQSFWLVADGMGGHKRGDFASKTIVQNLSGFSKNNGLSSNLQDIEERLFTANENCQAAYKGKRVGSTVAALFESHAMCFFIWAGDSRVYRMRDHSLELMTEDHSIAQEKFANGELSLEEAATHPSAHVLTRAVGAHRNLKLDLRYSDYKAGDRYLICSDGLYNDLTFEEIGELLDEGSIEQALNQLVECALDKGGNDNITAIVTEALE